MSKKLNTSQSNTLLNYFSSPKGKTTTKDNEIKSKQPITTNQKDESESDEEDELIVKNKRKRPCKIEDSPDVDVQEKNKAAIRIKRFKFDKTINDASSSEPEASSSTIKTPAKKLFNTEPTGWLHNQLEFLKPDKIRDANKRLANSPDYDNRTLHVPDDFLTKQTPAMRQWWILKSQHYDCILFFKVGKFYELYHMDAVIGVTELGLSYMKGDFAHSGFPEISYYKMANGLITKGYKVARIEQTETPEMMSVRCKKQTKTTKYDKVVQREICQISTNASLIYNSQSLDTLQPLSTYMYAIAEEIIKEKTIQYGICFIDTTIGIFYLAEFVDDEYCSKLLSVLAENRPGLFLLERRRAPILHKILNSYYKDIRREYLANDKEFLSAKTTIAEIEQGKYFQNETVIPAVLKTVIKNYSEDGSQKLLLKSLGACLWYLKDSKLDLQVVSMGRVEYYEPTDLSHENNHRNYMILDGATIKNLHLFDEVGGLHMQIDRCCTAFGKRLLQQWISRPLCNFNEIRHRQEAVKELQGNKEVLMKLQHLLKQLPDLERQLSKIHSYGNKVFSTDHPDSRAIFYESTIYSKRRINDLIKALKAFELAQDIPEILRDCESQLLKNLSQFPPDGSWIDLNEILQTLKTSFDFDRAVKEHKIMPERGVSSEYDEIMDAIDEINERAMKYLKKQEKFFGCSLTYFGSDKKRFQIDVPESYAKKVTNSYSLEGTKKGSKPSKRYTTTETKNFLAEILKAEEEKAKILKDLNRQIFQTFSEKSFEWHQTMECLANLDCLYSLALYASDYPEDNCLPEIEPFSKQNIFIMSDGRYAITNKPQNFVPNDLEMGVKGKGNILLLTGPNMGGKSTLMRQVALIAILGQIGSYVPAKYCRFNMVDRIFTRLGARDDILKGQSTFLVEMSEASMILKHATSSSLLLLDELGRGTSTHDGTAIATAYVRKLTEMNCRTLFATHYHSLIDYHMKTINIQLGFMNCMVQKNQSTDNEIVSFLYKLVEGRCPKSYGFNVARLAGLQSDVLARGKQIAKQLEEENKGRYVLTKLFSSSITDVRQLISTL